MNKQSNKQCKKQYHIHDWYLGHEVVNFIQSLTAKYDQSIISMQSCGCASTVKKQIQNFIKNEKAKHLFLPLCVNAVTKDFSAKNHWVGVYIMKTDAGYICRYIDPMGHDISTSVKNCLLRGLGQDKKVDFNALTIDNPIQCVTPVHNQTGDIVKYTGNTDDCGPMVAYLLSQLFHNGPDNIQTPNINTVEESYKFGTILRLCDKQKGNMKYLVRLLKNHLPMDNKNPPQSEEIIEEEIKDITDTLKKNKITVPPKFVISTIAYVDSDTGYESDESSELNSDDEDEEIFNFDIEKKETFPYRTSKMEDKTKKNSTNVKLKFIKLNGCILHNKKDLQKKEKYSVHKKNQAAETVDVESKTVNTLVNKLNRSGLEKNSEEKIEDVVSINIGLNRPLSLSTRKNNLLKKELAGEIKVDNENIQIRKFGMFWEYQWHNKEGKKVPYDTVRYFYKKLKKRDPDKADSFREENEQDVM